MVVPGSRLPEAYYWLTIQDNQAASVTALFALFALLEQYYSMRLATTFFPFAGLNSLNLKLKPSVPAGSICFPEMFMASAVSSDSETFSYGNSLASTPYPAYNINVYSHAMSPPLVYMRKDNLFHCNLIYCYLATRTHRRVSLSFVPTSSNTTIYNRPLRVPAFGAPGNVTRNTRNWLSTSIPASYGTPTEMPLVVRKSLSDWSTRV